MANRLIMAALSLLAVSPLGAVTPHNDGSCEITVAPAATLLLPFFDVDVVTGCTDAMPDNPIYYTTQILFDNVLIGDYQQTSRSTGEKPLAQANPMVHIRAVPEGGPVGSVPTPGTPFPYTFYDRYTSAHDRRMDRHVPLPSTFAARWIQEENELETRYKICREGIAIGAQTSSCSRAFLNSAMPLQTIRFDEHENAYFVKPVILCSPICAPHDARLPASFTVSTQESTPFAPDLSPDVGGWMYLYLNNRPPGLPGHDPARPSQNWVIVSMSMAGRYSVDFDAAHFGNGCTPASGPHPLCPPGLLCTRRPE